MFLMGHSSGLKKKNKKEPTGWNASSHPVKDTTPTKSLPWKTNTTKIIQNNSIHCTTFTDMNNCGSCSSDSDHEDTSYGSGIHIYNRSSNCSYSPRSPSFRRKKQKHTTYIKSNKVSPILTSYDSLSHSNSHSPGKPLAISIGDSNLDPNNNSDADFCIPHTPNSHQTPKSGRGGSAQGSMRRRRVSGNSHGSSVSPSNSNCRPVRGGSSSPPPPSNNHNRYKNIDNTKEKKNEDKGKKKADEADIHQHSHLIMYEANGLDNQMVMNGHESLSSGTCVTPIIQRSNADEEIATGWSMGVRKFNIQSESNDVPHTGMRMNEEDNSVYSPCERNVGQVPSASHVRDSLLKKEFNSIKQSLANSYKKYRDHKKADTDEKMHAIAYQYVENWLKKNKKMASNDSRITKQELTLFYNIFMKKVQEHLDDTGVKTLNIEALTEEFVKIQIFNGRIEANNFLLKIKLDEHGMLSLNDFIACIRSSSADLEVSHFKSFVRRIKKNDDRKKKLDETREKAREIHRQQQMASIAQTEGAANGKARRVTRIGSMVLPK